MDWIFDRLALGNLEDGKDVAQNRSEIITINICEEDYESPEGKHFHIPIPDQVFLEYPAITLIGNILAVLRWSLCRAPTLLHCREGKSRAPSLMMGYLYEGGMGFGEALEFLKSKRPIVDPHPDTMKTVFVWYRRMMEFQTCSNGPV